VRLAFNYAFDFEEMNRQIFYGQYKRITSYFEGTDLASSGLPTDRELELLETVRDKVPPEVFTRAYSNPAKSSGTRTPIPAQGGQQSGDCGQQVMAA
jgi:microcin C transport system substrate-binding protein